MIAIDLREKVILINGGLGGIAESVVRRLLEAGARVIVTDIRDDEAAKEKTCRWNTFREQFCYRKLDITDAASCTEAVEDIFREFPNINIALGHAGGCGLHPFASTSKEEFDRLIRFNFTGQTYFARAVLHEWVARGREGHLIFTSTFVARLPWKDISAYCAAKAGLEMFARCLALEYAEKQIRINCVAPGNVAAGSSKLLYETDREYREAVDRISPLGKRNSPEAIGDAFVYLCSSLASEVDGHILQVDAGVGLPKLV